MAPSTFEGLPELGKGKHLISELHVQLCKPPRPVAVRTKHGYCLLPQTLWATGEVVARASQGLELELLPSYTIYQFLVQLLDQAVSKRGLLNQLCHEKGEAFLTVLLTSKNSKQATLLAIEDSAGKAMAIADGAVVL